MNSLFDPADPVKPDLKCCPGCKKEKPVGQFHRMARSSDGLQSRCKVCQAESKRDRMARDGHVPNVKCRPQFLKYCKHCQLWKEVKDFHSHVKIGRQSACRVCQDERGRRYYEKNRGALLKKNRDRYGRKRETYLAAEKARRWNLRLAIVAAYGGKCVCCGENRPEFMTVDHINGGGSKHRKQLGSSLNFFRFLAREGYPKDAYRLLCYNCNLSRGALGYCPHDKEHGSKSL